MADPKDDETPEATEEQEPKADGALSKLLGSKVLLPAIGAVGAVGLSFLFTFVLFPMEATEGAEEEIEEEAEEGSDPDLEGYEPATLVDLPRVQITLADEGREGFLRIELKLEIRAEVTSEVVDGIAGELGIVIRDALITHISGKQSGELKTTEGKEILKLELMELLDSLIFNDERKGKVTGLYFHDLLVQ